MFTDSDSDAHVLREIRGRAIDLTKERGLYNHYVQVAGGEGNVERAVAVSPNEWRLKSREVVVYRESLRQVRTRETKRDGGGFLTVVRRQLRQECHQCLRSRHNQSNISTMPQAMQPNVRGVSIA